ncbi:hypothetical protein [Xanthocytophaga flava]|uniref:hypothetical protein n=1 Tax=Xanthocytophaga flava TaxID=3048013 RepID=UPI0028D5C577|nr:hypothetical protein [Xanthocytophaga flavus]MDJ1468168.1 hypothetical protein [Xanthocytophaga flavus]
MYELINTQGLRALIIDKHTVPLTSITQEHMATLFERKSRYVKKTAEATTTEALETSKKK